MQVKGQENRGGAREGSGRKPLNLSDREQRGLVKEFRKKAKETGVPVARILAEIAWADGQDGRPKEKTSHRLKAIEAYYNATIIRKSHSTVEGRVQGPQIYLPEVSEVPEEFKIPGYEIH